MTKRQSGGVDLGKELIEGPVLKWDGDEIRRRIGRGSRHAYVQQCLYQSWENMRQDTLNAFAFVYLPSSQAE